MRLYPSLTSRSFHFRVLSKMAEATRNWQPSGYYEGFVNAVEKDFQCLICCFPLKEPVITRCGHRFCKDCLEEHFIIRRCGKLFSKSSVSSRNHVPRLSFRHLLISLMYVLFASSCRTVHRNIMR